MRGKICIKLSMLIIIIACAGISLIHLSYESKASNNVSRIIFPIYSVATDDKSIRLENRAVFNENYFHESSTKFNKELAYLSLQMALAAASTSESEKNYGLYLSDVSYIDDNIIEFSKSRNGYLTSAYKAMGFSKDEYYKYEKSLNDSSDTVAHGIASKKLKIDGKEYTLVNIAIRSAGYGSEWASNFVLRGTRNMTGFNAAAADVYTNFRNYIKKHGLGENTKVWISGFSRGGATANITAAYIDRAINNGEISIKNEDVYAYTFATPNGVMDAAETEVNKEIYNNIHNIVYERDLVPLVAPNCWGFKKFGNEYVIPAIYIPGKEYDKIEEGKSQTNSEVTNEVKEIAKAVSVDYNNIRYGYSEKMLEAKKDKLFKGFTVKEEFLSIIDTIFGAFADNVYQYKTKWQSVFTDVIPFALGTEKKYDTSCKEWVKFDSLKDFLVVNYGEEIYEEAIETGVYQEEEYEKNVNTVAVLEKIGRIDEEQEESMVNLIDTLYAIPVVANSHDISKDDIKTTTTKLYNNLGTLLKGLLPIGDNINCVKNHDAEFYLALINNYDVEKEEYLYEIK